MSRHDDRPSAPVGELYRRLLAFLVPYRRTFGLAIGAMIIYGATEGAIPYLLKRILDDVFGRQDEEMLRLLVVVIIAFAFIRGIFGFFQKYLAEVVGLGIIEDLRNAINKKLLSLSPRFFHEHSTGSLISRVTNDTLIVRTALNEATAAVLRDTFRVIALLIVAFYLDPVLACIAFVGFPLGLYPVLRFGKKVRRLSRAGQDQFGGLTGLLQETIVGHRVVQSFTGEVHEHERFQKENRRFTEILKKASKYGSLSGPTNEFMASIAIAAVILYGGLTVISGVRTQGDFIAFVTSLFLLYEPLKKLSRINNLVQAGVASAERIFEVLDIEPDIVERPGAKVLHSASARIEYSGVWFSYGDPAETPTEDRDRRWAVADVSLLIEPGSTVALVGSSGGGKSTLVNLLPRFYDVMKGSITIGGVDIRDLTLSSLRQSIAVVDQHTFLFNDTIRANIAYGRLDATEDQIIAAAKNANAHDFIMALPQGYDTIIGEQGLKLSGGQRARMSIARALLKNAPVLILDEATASLDSESEELVQAAIDRLMQGRTVLVIAHRLSTIRQADMILAVVEGKISERGTHEELLRLGGEYAKLYRLQFRDQPPADELAARA